MKKNFNKIPDFIQKRVADIAPNEIQVVCIKKFTTTEIQNGVLARLGIVSTEQLHEVITVIPDKSTGRYSKINVDGKLIIRKDLDKVLKTFDCGTRPYFGDYSKGSFTLYITKLVYRKDLIPPQNLSICVETLDIIKLEQEDLYTLKICVVSSLNKTSTLFQEELLFQLNLLQESLGSVNVFSAESTHEDYLATMNVAWEILPIGNKDEVIRKMISKFRNPSEKIVATINDRYSYFMTLKPEKLIFCDTGLVRYFGASFTDNLVVFENINYGNAVYIMFDEWQELSKLNREEIKQFPDRYVRITHNDGWKNKIQTEINNRLGK